MRVRQQPVCVMPVGNIGNTTTSDHMLWSCVNRIFDLYHLILCTGVRVVHVLCLALFALIALCLVVFNLIAFIALCLVVSGVIAWYLVVSSLIVWCLVVFMFGSRRFSSCLPWKMSINISLTTLPRIPQLKNLVESGFAMTTKPKHSSAYRCQMNTSNMSVTSKPPKTCGKASSASLNAIHCWTDLPHVVSSTLLQWKTRESAHIHQSCQSAGCQT